MTNIWIFISFCFFGSNLTNAQSVTINAADSLYLNGNYSKAITIYETVEVPKNVYDKLAKAYVAIGNYDKALEYYHLNDVSHPDNALSKYEYAKLLSKTKHFEESVAQFNDLIKVDNSNPNYQYEMGLASEQMKDTTAFDRFMLAYKYDNAHQKAIFKIAKKYLQERNHDLSHQFIDKGLEAYANNVELTSLKAQNYYHQKFYKEARFWFEKLIELGESSEFIHEKMSLIYAEYSMWEKAIAQRKIALKYNPLDATAFFVIGTYYEQLKNFKEAEDYYMTAITLKDKPLDHEYQRLGFVYNRQDRFKEAIGAFQKSLKEDPSNVSSAFFLLTTKDKYYSDIPTKIKLYQDFIEKHESNMFTGFAKKRLRELKEEQFNGTIKTSNSNN